MPLPIALLIGVPAAAGVAGTIMFRHHRRKQLRKARHDARRERQRTLQQEWDKRLGRRPSPAEGHERRNGDG